MIGFQNNETLITEGIIDDSLKALNIDKDQVKADWQDAKDAEIAADKVKAANKIANDDVLDPLRKDIDSIRDKVKDHTVDRRSMIARSRNSVVQFPVYVTQTIRVNEAHIISKLFERVYATLFQTILAQNPIIDQEEANDLVFLKKFHTNINESADLILFNEFYNPIDEMDEILKESAYYEEQVTPTMKVKFRAVPCTDQYLIKECARLSHEPLEGLSYLSEANDMKEKISEANASYKNLTDKDLEEIAMDKANLTKRERELINKKAEDIKKEIDVAASTATNEEKKASIDRQLKQKAAAQEKLNNSLTQIKNDIKNGKFKDYKYDGVRYQVKIKGAKDTYRPMDTPKAPIFLKDSDIKKINGLLPYTIEASFIMQDKEKNPVREVKFIIGIKTDLHLIRMQDLAEDLREIVTGNIKSLQKVRYKTGEITFMDYLFNTKGIKNDAAKSVNYNKRWLNTLKRLGEWEKTNGSLLKKSSAALTNGNVPIPNGTMVLSQTDVTTMMNQTGIDLSLVSNAKRLARSLFLIAVCIVDSSAGTMRVLFPDSSNDWDIQSLASIDAELSKTDNSQLMRELNRMVNH